MMKQLFPLLFIALLLLQGTTAFADSISVSASVDRKIVSVGDTIQLTVAIEGAQSVGAPDLPDIDGFQAQYVGPSTQVSIVNGRMSASVSHIYSLVALKVGKYTINPISVEYRGKTYQTKPITVEVVQGATPQRRSQAGTQQADELKDYIYLTLTAPKEKLYLNEELPITIRLYSRRLDVRDIEYPTFSSNGFSVRKFEKPIQTQEVVDGVIFDVIKFQTIV
ncbi:MAG: BatD family protein, partial [Candidatus Poribacteria bacterium]